MQRTHLKPNLSFYALGQVNAMKLVTGKNQKKLDCVYNPGTCSTIHSYSQQKMQMMQMYYCCR